MCIRQVGHFFFEPKGYDEENQATHEYKEKVKVGFNLRRKVILHCVWALVPIALYFAPTVFGIFRQPWTDLPGYLEHLARLWIGLAGGRAAVPHRPPLLPARREDGAGLVHQDPHRPVPRHLPLSPRAALPDARRDDRARQAARLARWVPSIDDGPRADDPVGLA